MEQSFATLFKLNFIFVHRKRKPNIKIMKKLTGLGLLFVFLISGSLQAQEGKKVTDFRGIEWGAHKDSIFRNGEKVNFSRVKNGVESNSFTIPNDDMTIGTVEFDNVQYIFNDNNRFKKIFLEAQKKYITDMEFILTYKFGEADKTQELGYVTIRRWKLDNVVFTLSDFNNSRDIFTVNIESQWERSAKMQKNRRVDDF